MTTIWVRVDESWFLMKHQIKRHQVFIWNETCFSSQIKYFHFYCFVWEDLSKKRGVRASSRVPNTYGLVLSSVFRCLEPVMKHLPSFFGILHQTQVCHTLLHGLLPLKLLVSHYFEGVGVTSNSLCGISYVVSGGSHLGVFYSSQQLIIFLKQLPLNLTTNCAKYFAT